MVVGLASCARQPGPSSHPANSKGASAVTQNELVEALRRLSPDQQAELDALAKNVVNDSRALPRAAAAHLDDPDPNLAENAMSLLIHIEELATVPMLEAPEPEDAYGRVARLTIAMDSLAELRNTIVDRLKKMLEISGL
jgi:hypothetical protein